MVMSGAAEYAIAQLIITTSAKPPSRNSKMGGTSLGQENTSKPRLRSEPANSWLSSCLESASKMLIPFDEEVLAIFMAYQCERVVRSEENVPAKNCDCSDQRTLPHLFSVENSIQQTCKDFQSVSSYLGARYFPRLVASSMRVYFSFRSAVIGCRDHFS